MRLKHNTYGKANIQVLKVFRDGGRHTVREISVSVRVEGELEENYTEADNRSCVPTDTIKGALWRYPSDGESSVTAFFYFSDKRNPTHGLD
jgi:urate oxidase